MQETDISQTIGEARMFETVSGDPSLVQDPEIMTARIDYVKDKQSSRHYKSLDPLFGTRSAAEHNWTKKIVKIYKGLRFIERHTQSGNCLSR